uniref:Kinesin-like protein KIF2A-like N-terminal domain-containing protein n=1 Tax=Timema shepardi TaxID=629360 RepID=A0A7R9AT35_TIMSH|nr:unnamed protein product [Timema shepardi]
MAWFRRLCSCAAPRAKTSPPVDVVGIKEDPDATGAVCDSSPGSVLPIVHVLRYEPRDCGVPGRVHTAVVSGINYETHSVTVEWFERGETKGKEVRHGGESITLIALGQGGEFIALIALGQGGESITLIALGQGGVFGLRVAPVRVKTVRAYAFVTLKITGSETGALSPAISPHFSFTRFGGRMVQGVILIELETLVALNPDLLPHGHVNQNIIPTGLSRVSPDRAAVLPVLSQARQTDEK